MTGERVTVLLAAGGAAWEGPALQALGRAGLVVLKRCVDLRDLLASAATGQAQVALVDGNLGGLDADAVGRLARDGARCVAVEGDAAALARIGVAATVSASEPATLAETVARVVRPGVEDAEHSEHDETPPVVVPAARGRVVVVHGPTGAPGRTTLATSLAALHAGSGHRTVLVDADPYGGAVAQHLGVLDEVSGLLAAARLANAGALDPLTFSRCRREVVAGLDVVTGLPRPDRWVEVRSGALDQVLDASAQVGEVVVDTGFGLEDDTDLGRPVARDQLTLDAIAGADAVVAVGSAEPTGLARLARTLVDLHDLTAVPVTVVVNRMRDSLGWSRRDITGMVEGYSRPAGVHFLPEDRAAIDRALVHGRAVPEAGDSALRRALQEVHAGVLGPPPSRR